MAVPAWFDVNVYLANKLAQLQKANPSANWTSASLASALTAAGFLGTDGAYDHFVKFGASENLSPNSLFSPDEYFQAKAAQFYKKAATSVTDLEVSTVKQLIANAGLNAWTHYVRFGSAEGVNPSNSFDESDYLAAKLAALKVADPTNWGTKTVADVSAAFKAAGYSALTHFLTFKGTGTAEVAATATFTVPDAEKVTPTTPTTTGQTFTLTNSIDSIVGTSGNDTIIAGTQAGQLTLNAGDSINGGAGTDTLNIYDGSENLGSITLAGVEIVNDYDGANAINLSANTGVTQIWAMKASVNAVTAAKTQIVGFGDAAGGAAAVATFTDDAGAADAATIAVQDAGKTTAYTSIAVAGIETLTVNATGTNQLGTLTAAAASKLVFTGAGAVTTTLSDAALYKTIDGSAATGALTITASGATVSNQVLDIKTGSGNDEYVTLFANLTKEDKIDLGAGTDTLTFADTTDLSASVATLAGVTNVETLKVTAGNFLVNGDLVSQTTFNHSSTGTFTGTNIASTDKLVVGGVNTGISTVAMKLGQTTFNLDLAGSKAAAADASTLTVTGATTINVNSTGTAGVANNNLELTTDSNGTINVTGSQNLTMTAAVPGGSTTGLTINASTFTGKATITGSAQADAITGGSGADTLTGGAGADTLTGGAGADTFAFAVLDVFGADGAAVADVITDFVVGTDKLQFTAINDVVSVQQSAVQAAVTALAAGSTDAQIATAMANANTTNLGVSFAVFNGNTYVYVETVGATATHDADANIFVKLTGVTTAPTFALDVIA